MSAVFVFPLAALAEILGCFAVWVWWKNGASPLWLIAAGLCLAAFGWLLAQVDVKLAGRAFAAYGGVYIVASLLWMWIGEGMRPTLRDAGGAALCLLGAAIILAQGREG